MSYDLQGKLHKKYDTETKGEKAFKSRDFVVVTDEQYPQYIKFQLAQDRCELIDDIREGTPVKVSFDLRGREYNGKYFTNLNAWRIVPEGAAPGHLATKAEQDDSLPF